MAGYWIRHRLAQTLILGLVLAIVAGLLFAYPCIIDQADRYTSQSIYKNSEIDFIAPEPSFEQVRDLPGTHGIDRIFPFLMTKTEVSVNGRSRTTNVLLSDLFQNVDMTMYSPARLIEQSSANINKPILVDWQFCHDTSATVGDVVTIMIGGTPVDYTISAIYETNSVYDGGAILAPMGDELMNAIMEQSKNNGYSGMFVSANDYDACQAYLTTEYRPLGRLKSADQFENDAQYQVHYDAIMSSGYANEITDFRVRENSLDNAGSTMMIWMGAALVAIALIAFNVVMAKRGCEQGYFLKHCIPKGQAVRPYYSISFVAEVIWSIVAYTVVLILRVKSAPVYIPKAALGVKTAVIPVAILVAGLISLALNYSMVSTISKEMKPAPAVQKAVQNETLADANSQEQTDDQAGLESEECSPSEEEKPDTSHR